MSLSQIFREKNTYIFYVKEKKKEQEEKKRNEKTQAYAKSAFSLALINT